MEFEILLVDDDSMICMVHRLLLQSAGVDAKPVSRGNGLQALRHLDKESRSPNKRFLIFLDINMPVMDGWKFLDELQQREYKDRVDIVMVTSSVNMMDRKKAESYPQIIDYVEKPLEFESIKRWIKDPSILPYIS